MTDLTTLAEQIADDSAWAWTIAYPEEYEQLSEEDRMTVEGMLYDIVQPCDECGWISYREELEALENGEEVCWRCYQDHSEEE